MYSIRQRFVRLIAACSIAAVVFPMQTLAQSHVVSPTEMQQQAVAASQARQANADSLKQALSGSEAQKAMKAANIDPAQVKTAIASLSDAELARLNARAANAQSDFAAGRMSDRDLLLILVAIAALILIIVAVR